MTVYCFRVCRLVYTHNKRNKGLPGTKFKYRSRNNDFQFQVQNELHLSVFFLDELFFLRSMVTSEGFSGNVQALPLRDSMTFSVDACTPSSVAFQSRLNGAWIYKINIGTPNNNWIQIEDSLLEEV